MNSAMKFLCLSAILTTSSAFVNPFETITYHASLASPLCAVHPGWGASRGVPSKTARESAYACEWEPMTELERRIEDGINYEHSLYNEDWLVFHWCFKTRLQEQGQQLHVPVGTHLEFVYQTDPRVGGIHPLNLLLNRLSWDFHIPQGSGLPHPRWWKLMDV